MTDYDIAPRRPPRSRGAQDASISSRWMRTQASSTVSSCPGPGASPSRSAGRWPRRRRRPRGPSTSCRSSRSSPTASCGTATGTARRGIPGSRWAASWSGPRRGVVVERRPDRRLRPRPRRARLAPLVGRHALGRVGAAARVIRTRAAAAPSMARRGPGAVRRHEPGSGGHGAHAGPPVARGRDAFIDKVEAPLGRARLGAVGGRGPGRRAVRRLHRAVAGDPRPRLRVAWRPAGGWRAQHWGHGYATEAAREALRFGFRGRRASTRSCRSRSPQNVRSRAVMERIGLERGAGRRLRPPQRRRGRLSAHRAPRALPAGPTDLGRAPGLAPRRLKVAPGVPAHTV